MLAHYLDYCLVPNLALKMESKTAAMMADYLDCCLVSTMVESLVLKMVQYLDCY